MDLFDVVMVGCAGIGVYVSGLALKERRMFNEYVEAMRQTNLKLGAFLRDKLIELGERESAENSPITELLLAQSCLFGAKLPPNVNYDIHFLYENLSKSNAARNYASEFGGINARDYAFKVGRKHGFK